MKREIIRAALGFALSLFTAQLPAAPAPVTADEAKEIAVSAYIYAYPLVLMDVTRKVQSNSEVSDARTKHAPINQFYHAPEFPDSTPVRVFWSLTLYNDRQFLADNLLSRYAIGDRDDLKFNADGSLDLYIQRASPGADKESNWLPTPKEGGFSLTMRLYWPKANVLDGTWQPPAMQHVK
jgi:hypothetical protein